MPLRSVYVGLVQCTFVTGAGLTPLKTRLRTWAVPGLAGVGAAVLGQSDGEGGFVVARFMGTKAAAATWVLALGALQGTVCQVIDDEGRTHTGWLVTRVGPPEYSAALSAALVSEVVVTVRIEGTFTT